MTNVDQETKKPAQIYCLYVSPFVYLPKSFFHSFMWCFQVALTSPLLSKNKSWMIEFIIKIVILFIDFKTHKTKNKHCTKLHTKHTMYCKQAKCHKSQNSQFLFCHCQSPQPPPLPRHPKIRCVLPYWFLILHRTKMWHHSSVKTPAIGALAA